jgi:ribulose-phosphate 3-epimerase
MLDKINLPTPRRCGKVKIAPSVLSADFSDLAGELRRAERAGADLLHIDIMDGHFVPNITIGPQVVAAIRRHSRLPLDVHLMIENPEKFIKNFTESGASIITVHIESIARRASFVIRQIRYLGVKVGIALNPSTPLSSIENLLNEIDMVLIMSVDPGFSGQRFIRSALSKIRNLRKIYEGDIGVDGGINQKTGREAIKAGANILAAGTYLFKAKDMKMAIKALRQC